MIIFLTLANTRGRTFIDLRDVFFVCTHQPQVHLEISCYVEFFGSATTSFPQHFRDTRDEHVIHFQDFSKSFPQSGAFTAITSVVSKSTALLSSDFPRSRNFAKLIRNQQRYEPQFAATAHVSKELQVGDIPRSRLLEGENDGHMCAHANKNHRH